MLRRGWGKGSDGSAASGSGGQNFNGASQAELAAEVEVWVSSVRPELGEVLVSMGYITVEHLDYAKAQVESTGETMGAVLTRLHYVDDHQLAAGIAEQLKVPFIDLRDVTPDPGALTKVGEELARKYKVLPVWIDDERVFLATADPLNDEAIIELTSHCERIGLLIGASTEIERLLDRYYNALSSADVHIQAFELSEEQPTETDTGPSMRVDENAPIVQVVNRIVTQGVRSRASDIHIEPHEHAVKIRYRIDGALSEALQLPTKMGSPLASRVKVLADLNIVERRRPQDGQFSMKIDGRPIDVRTSVVSTIHGEKIVMRLLDKTRSLIRLTDMGMPEETVKSYLKIVKAPVGMLLCTGPTGSGKTTTLYATLGEVDDPTKNVITIEDPVEYQFDGVNQMQVTDIGGMSFAEGLRGTLRQDPDVILVGEIRDIETARIATQAALTGHFVMSSLHAVDSVAAVHRFMDMGIEPFLVASAISGVVGQRLLRKICSSCKAPYSPSASDIRAVRGSVGREPEVWMKGMGCNVCNHTGYRGRQGVYELLTVDDNLRELIVAKAAHNEMRNAAVANGMRTMQEEAFDLVAQGITTVEEVLRAVYAPSVDRDDDSRPLLALEAGPLALEGTKATALGPVEEQAAIAMGTADGDEAGSGEAVAGQTNVDQADSSPNGAKDGPTPRTGDASTATSVGTDNKSKAEPASNGNGKAPGNGSLPADAQPDRTPEPVAGTTS